MASTSTFLSVYVIRGTNIRNRETVVLRTAYGQGILPRAGLGVYVELERLRGRGRLSLLGNDDPSPHF